MCAFLLEQHVTIDRKAPDQSRSMATCFLRRAISGSMFLATAEEGIAQAIRAEQERLWRMENAQAIADANAFVEKRGLSLARYRKF